MRREERSKSTFEHPPSQMTEAVFMTTFGGIYEHSPWVAEALWKEGVDGSVDLISAFHTRMVDIVNSQAHNIKMKLLKAHPDLAGRAAARGELTADSTTEQSRAGLDRCSAGELQRLSALNRQYRDRFGFPFIMAVRNSDKEAIFAAFTQRLQHTRDQEFARAMEEVHRIALFRLEEI